MRILLFILRKEFSQIRRNPAIIRIIFVMPVIQLLILPLAADYEVKNVNVSVIDHDHSTYSQQLITKLEASSYFNLVDYSENYSSAMNSLEKDAADMIIEIPPHFERDLVRENAAKIKISANAVNGAKGNIGAAYAANLIAEYNAEIREHFFPQQKYPMVPVIDITYSNWYNPHMRYPLYMVPGILVLLLTLVASFMTALNIVHEKEVGTIEQINVSPIKKYQFILGKLLPFWIIGMVVLTLGLLISRLVYGIIPEGNLLLIYAFAAVYLLALLGIGLLISTFAESQQQAMFISFFFMLVFILMSGLYTSIDGMPHWAQIITKCNPVSYFIEVMRMIVMKGSGFAEIAPNFIVMGIMAILFNALAVFNYQKQT